MKYLQVILLAATNAIKCAIVGIVGAFRNRITLARNNMFK